MNEVRAPRPTAPRWGVGVAGRTTAEVALIALNHGSQTMGKGSFISRAVPFPPCGAAWARTCGPVVAALGLLAAYATVTFCPSPPPGGHQRHYLHSGLPQGDPVCG